MFLCVCMCVCTASLLLTWIKVVQLNNQHLIHDSTWQTPSASIMMMLSSSVKLLTNSKNICQRIKQFDGKYTNNNHVLETLSAYFRENARNSWVYRTLHRHTHTHTHTDTHTNTHTDTRTQAYGVSTEYSALCLFVCVCLSVRRMSPQLRWCGHVLHMSNERTAKQLLYVQLADNTQSQGRPESHLGFRSRLD